MGMGKKITIGFWYGLGMHFGLASGPIDALRKIVAGGRVAWSGNVTTSQDITINAKELFGGEKKEGGIQGTCSVCMGEADQLPHPYLVQQLGTPMPAFRGLVTLVYRGLIAALNPYIKLWSFQVSRWTAGWRTAVWQPTLCKVGEGMNPAHFVYRAITDPITGLGRDPVEALDLVRMQEAAQIAFDEGLGLCLKWSRSDVTANFLRIICDHAGGDMVDDPTTGKQYLKLYRGGYNVATLPELDESNVLDVLSYEQPGLAGSVNQVIATYRDCETNKDAAVTVSNLANIQAQGRVISQPKRYDGAWNADLATRLGARDLHATSSLPARLKLVVRASVAVRKGDVLAFTWPRLNLQRMPIRVLEVGRGNSTDGKITLTCARDVYSLPSTSYVVGQPPLWTAPDLAPHPVPAQRLIEASYRDLVLAMSAGDLAQVAPEAGYAAALGARPNGVSYDYSLLTRIGTSGAFRTVAAEDFAPSGLLAALLPREAGPSTVALTSPTGLAQVDVGTAALVDDELCRVDAIDSIANTATLARGCVDTVPAEHAVGARVWFLDAYLGIDPTEYILGESIQAKLLTRTGMGTLAEADATAIGVTMAERQIRPYPPGNLKINGVAYPAAVTGALTLTWSHRDRLQSADQLIDTLQGNIGPEAGNTYTVRTYFNGALASTVTGLTTTTYAPSVKTSGAVRVEVDAVRDGFSSWQPLRADLDFTYTGAAPDVFNPADKGPNVVLSNGGYTMVRTGSGYSNMQVARSVRSHATGKFYIEGAVNRDNNNWSSYFGLCTASIPLSYTTNPTQMWSVRTSSGGASGANTALGGTATQLSPVVNFASGAVVGVAVDFDAGKMWFRINGNWIVGATLGATCDPTNGVNPAATFTPGTQLFAGGMSPFQLTEVTLNTGQSPYRDLPPTGFEDW